jgi:hypothetical protein
MQRSVWAVFGVLLALVAFPQSQNSTSQIPQESAGSNLRDVQDPSATIISLAQQSHDLNSKSDVNSQVYLLERQITLILRRNPELARQWIDELFALSLEQRKGSPVVVTQQMAITDLSQIDPDAALNLLNRMSTTNANQKQAMISAKSAAASPIFAALIARDGVNALPVVEHEAELLAIDDTYPYGALGAAANAAAMKDWRSNRDRAVSLIQATFERAFARYRDRPASYSEDYAFGDMLIHLGGSLPNEVLRPALDLLVQNLLMTDTKAYQVQAQMFACDGREVKADNAIDAVLLRLAALMNRVDPELAQHLQEGRPALRAAIEETTAGCQRALKIGPNPQNTRLRNPNVQLQADAMQFEHINTDAAIAKAQQITDENLRVQTLLRIAGDIAENEPERAAKLVIDAEMNLKNADARMQLNLITAEASVAAAQQKNDNVRELLQRGFEIAMTKGAEGASGPLLRIAIQNDPSFAMMFLQNLPPSPEKAQLLVEVASELDIESLQSRSRAQRIVKTPPQ